jgi:hypothetical protein
MVLWAFWGYGHELCWIWSHFGLVRICKIPDRFDGVSLEFCWYHSGNPFCTQKWSRDGGYAKGSASSRRKKEKEPKKKKKDV